MSADDAGFDNEGVDTGTRLSASADDDDQDQDVGRGTDDSRRVGEHEAGVGHPRRPGYPPLGDLRRHHCRDRVLRLLCSGNVGIVDRRPECRIHATQFDLLRSILD